MQYAESFTGMTEELKKLPGIGPKSAQRIAFYLLEASKTDVEKLIDSIKLAKDNIKHCSTCYNITDTDPCRICLDFSRDQGVLCVVAEPKDLIAIERSGGFSGKYHVLGGVFSPLDGIGPEHLRVKELVTRLPKEKFKEIIFAFNPTAEGEATGIYLTKLIKPLGVKITRVAYGLPIGSDMDYADEATLMKAFEGRRDV
jgi:recombination protein RecR